ncbi:MAG: hypothetical protein O2897_03880, partial [bacterium]|nr:hypothetical protein [bacterium]
IGLIKIITHFSYRLSLRSLINSSALTLANFIKLNAKELEDEVLNFILTRARGFLIEELTSKSAKNPTLVADAALAAPTDDLADLWARAFALNNLALQDEETFKKLAATFKRVGNIVQQASAKNQFNVAAEIDKTLLVEPCELKLAKAVTLVQKQFEQKKVNGDLTKHYMGLLKTIAELKPLVDEFFDGVMVMCDDLKLRSARLHLLSDIEQMVNSVANFAKIEI